MHSSLPLTKSPKPRRRKRKIFLTIVAFIVVVFLTFQAIDLVRNPRSPDKHHLAEWHKPGNIILTYRSSLDPRPTGTRNVYSVHAPDGTLIDRITGDGIERQFALPTHGGTYVYFPDEIRFIGNQQIKQEINYPSGHTDYSPSGDFGIALTRIWSGNTCDHQAAVLKADGAIVTADINISPDSLALSEHYGLVIGNCGGKAKLVAINSDGNVEELPLPLGFQQAPGSGFPLLNYLGNDRFELVKENKIDNSTFELSSFEFTYGEKHKDSATAIATHSYTAMIPEIFERQQWISGGSRGYIQDNGDVYVLNRLHTEAVPTGTITNYQGQYIIHVNSPTTEPLFGLQQEETVTIRQWSQPAQVIATLPISEHTKACNPKLCYVTGLDIIP